VNPGYDLNKWGAVPGGDGAGGRVVVIDAQYFIYRAHAIMPPLKARDGSPAAAAIGFADFLLKVLRETRPTWIACCFDGRQTESYRREIYPDYKAHRPPAPVDLVAQLPLCHSIAEAAGCTVFHSNRYEADDLVGTLAATAQAQARPVTLVGVDKDLVQLIGPHDLFWRPSHNEVLNAHAVERRFGVPPRQIADQLALTGDVSDNIPGVPGVGQKTAARLLRKLGDLEDVLARAMEVRNLGFRNGFAVTQALLKYADQVRLARRLTGIVQDVPMPGLDDVEALHWRGCDRQAQTNLFDYLDLDGPRRREWAELSP